MSLTNLLRETVWMCPFCSWSLLTDEVEFLNKVGIESVLLDHLDIDHQGWTLKKIFEQLGYD